MLLSTLLAIYLHYGMPIWCELASMQGHWQLTLTHDGKPNELYPDPIPVVIKRDIVICLFKDASKEGVLEDLFKDTKCRHAFNRMHLNPLIRPKAIGIAWCEGIYEVTQDRIRFCIKYHGQGVEGEAARRWKAPVDFVVRVGQDHEIWTFERIKKK